MSSGSSAICGLATMPHCMRQRKPAPYCRCISSNLNYGASQMHRYASGDLSAKACASSMRHCARSAPEGWSCGLARQWPCWIVSSVTAIFRRCFRMKKPAMAGLSRATERWLGISTIMALPGISSDKMAYCVVCKRAMAGRRTGNDSCITRHCQRHKACRDLMWRATRSPRKPHSVETPLPARRLSPAAGRRGSRCSNPSSIGADGVTHQPCHRH